MASKNPERSSLRKSSELLIRRAEIDGGGENDLRCADGRIVEIGERLAARPGTCVLDAGGGALLPGFHDHHIHLLALAAAAGSIRCGPPEIRNVDDFLRTLRNAPPGDGWLRGVGYHESVAGELDRWRLDNLVSKRPVRVQHRSGALWVLNSAGIDRLKLDAGVDAHGIERNRDGRATGRLFRLDRWLRDRIGPGTAVGLLPEVSRRLASYGVTGLTDATFDNDTTAVQLLDRAVADGHLLQRVVVMGGLELSTLPSSPIEVGAVKLVLDERELPEFDDLRARVAAAHGRGRPVAIHCVTRAVLVVAIEALRAAGVRKGDRIEHASIAPPTLVESLRDLGLIVVTQPGFIHDRGDAYLSDVEPDDQPWLYRCRGFLDASVALAAGTDAPFGDPDPWVAMRAAIDRRTAANATIGPNESLSPEQALRLFTSTPSLPGRCWRTLKIGEPADLCLLDRPWHQARDEMTSALVRATIRGGEIVWQRP